MNILDIARNYHLAGFAPIPVPFRDKNPNREGWQNLVIPQSDLANYFNGKPQNIGILLGQPSRNLVDVDCDSKEAVALAANFLPKTDMVFGRQSKPNSHWEYIANPLVPTTKFLDVRKELVNGKQKQNTIVELRGTGGQTVFPGSTHETGEPIRFSQEGEPTAIEGDVLLAQVAKLAAGALLAKYWPGEGSRHHAELALAGGLIRAGWAIEDVTDFVVAVAEAGGGEPDKETRTRVAQFTADRLAQSKHVTGWPTFAKIIGKDVADRACEWLGISQDRQYDDTPDDPVVVNAMPWPDPPEPEAYYGLAGQIVRKIEPHTEADPIALLGHVFLYFGNCIGRSAYFEADGARHYGNLFSVFVGETAKGRKGTAQRQVHRLFESVLPDWAKTRNVEGLSSGEGLIWAVRDPIQQRQPVKEKGRVVDYEDVEVDPGIQDKRLFVVEAEFASTLKVSQRETNTLSAIIRRAWDSGNLQTLTKNAPAVATNAHVSIIGHITKDELRKCLDATETANGFANRFIWVCVRRSKCLPEGGAAHTLDFGTEHRALAAAIENAREATVVTRDAQARSLWAKVYEELSDGHPGMLGAVCSRAEAQVMRLALLYALLDCSRVIRIEHLRAALAFWKYSEASARYIFGNSLGDRVADDLLSALRASPRGLTRKQITVDVFSTHRNADQIGRALSTLLERNLIRREVHPDTGGRPAEHWLAVQADANKANYANKAVIGSEDTSLSSLSSHTSEVIEDSYLQAEREALQEPHM